MAKKVGGRKISRKRRRGGGGRRRERACAGAGVSDNTSDEDYVVAEEEEEEEEEDGGSSDCSYSSDASLEDASSVSDSTSYSEDEEDDEEEEELEENELSGRGRSLRRPRSSGSRRMPKTCRRKKSRVPRVVEKVEASLMRRSLIGSRRGSTGSNSDDGVEDEYEDHDDVDFAPDENDSDDEYLASSRVRKAAGRKEAPLKRSTRRSRYRNNKEKGKDKKKAAVKKKRKRKSRSSDDDFVVDDLMFLDDTNTKRRRSSSGRKRRTNRSKVSSVSEEDDFSVEVDRSSDPTNGKKRKAKSVSKVKKRRGRATFSGTSDSDFDYTISQEELNDLIGGPCGCRKQKTLSSASKEEEKRRGKVIEGVAEQVCGICLSDERKGAIRGVLDCCVHYFCFACIMEWSKVESRCPLCKQRFKTVSRSSRSDEGLSVRPVIKRIPKRDQVYKPSEEEMRRYLDPYLDVVCMECQRGGDDQLMLLCDICDSSAHTYCVGLGREVPEGNWYCYGCRFINPEPSNFQVQESMVEHGERTSNLFQDTDGEIMSVNNIDRIPHESSHSSSRLMSSRQLSGVSEDASRACNSSPSDNRTSLPSTSFVASTLSGRRSIHRRIQVMLSNSGTRWTPERVAGNVMNQHSRAESDVCNSEVDHPLETLDVHRECPASEINAGSSRLFMTPRAQMPPCMHNDAASFSTVEGTKTWVRSMVKKCLTHLTRRNPLDRRAFKDVARRATHTVLAACGARHDQRLVHPQVGPLPGCVHGSDTEFPEPMRDTCSSCFAAFVGGVVRRLLGETGSETQTRVVFRR